MKQVHPSYSFSASTKTITLTGLNIDQDQLLLIVNATRGVQYFNFADSSLRATVTAGANTSVVLTDASTAGHANGDALVIYYDDQVTSQVVSGTVTANPGTGAFTVSGTVGLDNASLVALENITVTVGSSVVLAAGSAQVGSVTVANFPPTQTIAGTVTANVAGNLDGTIENYDTDGTVTHKVAVQIYDPNGQALGGGAPLPISGTVTANLANVVTTDIFWNVPAIKITGGNGYGIDIAGEDASGNRAIFDEGGGVPVFPREFSGNFPIAGTVTANNPNGSLTTRFGSVVTANESFITSAVTNTSRKYLLAQNISAGTVTIGIGFSPTTTQGIQLTAGAGLTFDAFCPTGAVYWLGAVTGAAWTILEG